VLSGDQIQRLGLLPGAPAAPPGMAAAPPGAPVAQPGVEAVQPSMAAAPPGVDAVQPGAPAAQRDAEADPLGAPAGEPAAFQPNGVDLSLEAVWLLDGRGSLGRSNAQRELPPRALLAFDADDWLVLPPGAYGIRYAEWVELPRDCAGLCFPRSSLLRMGVHVPTAVWDAGYAGRGEGLLQVSNPHGVRLQRGAGIVQLVVFRLSEAARTGYAGNYQYENRH
jgi:dUTP pyrophosphatase